jgi:2-oxoglutarate dehydrogenase complex dehydrogenase (E1) component-like enzyme
VPAGGRLPRYVGRAESASPAPGRLKVHLAEQQALARDALRLAATPTANR